MTHLRSKLFSVAFSFLSAASCGGNDEIEDSTPSYRQYVIDEVVIPADVPQATALSRDMGGDGVPDNKLGNLLAQLGSTSGIDVQSSVSDEVDRGSIVLLADLRSMGISNSSDAQFSIYFGEVVMPMACLSVSDVDCRQHLQGDASFRVAADSPANTPLSGTVVRDELETASGELSLKLSLEGADEPLRLNLENAQIQAKLSADGIVEGVVSGAVPSNEIDADLMPSINQILVTIVSEECALEAPECCSDPESQGKQILEFFDTNQDCQVPLDEFKTSPLIRLALSPDLDSSMDNIEQDSLSLGVGFTAVRASFEVP